MRHCDRSATEVSITLISDAARGVRVLVGEPFAGDHEARAVGRGRDVFGREAELELEEGGDVQRGGVDEHEPARVVRVVERDERGHHQAGRGGGGQVRDVCDVIEFEIRRRLERNVDGFEHGERGGIVVGVVLRVGVGEYVDGARGCVGCVQIWFV